MKKMILVLILVFLFQGIASAGILFGRIIKEDGKSLAKTKVIFGVIRITTNAFGDYKVELNDGELELQVVIKLIKEDGTPLAKTKVIFEVIEVTTNAFGGYKVELNDGECELHVVINNEKYTSERIRIYSPETKQNWLINENEKRLRKIR